MEKKIKLWVANKVVNEIEVSESELKSIFRTWVNKMENVWLEYQPSSKTILFFLTDKSGLNSTFDEADCSLIEEMLKPVLFERLGYSVVL